MAEKAFASEHYAVLSELFAGEAKCRVESECVLPDYKEEAHRIIRVNAKARLNSKNTTLQDRCAVVEAEGVVTFNILYQSDPGADTAPGKLDAHVTQERFSYTFKVPLGDKTPTLETLVSLLELAPENTSFKLLGPRKIAMRCDVALHLVQKYNRPLDFFPAHLADDVQIKGQTIPLTRLVTAYQEDFAIQQTIALPDAYLPIRELCDLDVFLFAATPRCEEGGVDFRVLCDLSCSYIADTEESFISFYQPIELEKSVGIPAVSQGQTCQVTLMPNFLRAVAEVNENGENKNLAVEIGYTAEVLVFQTEQVFAAEDAFSTESELAIEKETKETEEVLGVLDFAQTLRQQIPAATKGMLRAEELCAETVFKGCGVEDGKIVIEGKLKFCFVGVMEDGTLAPFENSTDFRCSVLPGAGIRLGEQKGLKIELVGGVRAIDLVPDQNGYNLRFDLCGTMTVFERREAEVIAVIARGEPFEEEKKGLLFFYPEEGETLWNICKSLHASPARVRADNGVESDALPRVLIITK